MPERPKWALIMDELLQMIERRGEEDFKESLSAKIRTGAEVPASAHREAAKKPHTGGSLNE